MTTALTIKAIDLHYGAAQALKAISIECKPGRITAVLGRNGVGKSSTLRAVTGINNVSSGEIVFDNEILKKAAGGPLKGILEYTEEPLVSVDFNHSAASGTVDALLTKVIDGTLVKVCAWYDNEWGFSNRMLDTTLAWSRAA